MEIIKSILPLLLIAEISGFFADTPGETAVLKNNSAVKRTGGPVEGRDWESPATGMKFIWVPSLEIWAGKYEVTNGEYRQKEKNHDSGDYCGYTLNKDSQPAVFVNFADAVSYAEWMTGRDSGFLPPGLRYRLPSEDEWTKCAQCGDGREFPWGSKCPPVSDKAGN